MLSNFLRAARSILHGVTWSRRKFGGGGEKMTLKESEMHRMKSKLNIRVQEKMSDFYTRVWRNRTRYCYVEDSEALMMRYFSFLDRRFASSMELSEVGPAIDRYFAKFSLRSQNILTLIAEHGIISSTSSLRKMEKDPSGSVVDVWYEPAEGGQHNIILLLWGKSEGFKRFRCSEVCKTKHEAAVLVSEIKRSLDDSARGT